MSALAIDGAAAVVVASGERCDPTALLPQAKTRKYMSAQDEMAVVAAERALTSAGLGAGPLGARVGLYLTVGYIPFEYDDIARVVEASSEAGAFSLARFTRQGWQRARPLVAFRCLPNMPAFHVSAAFGIEGPCIVLYPGSGQFYLALDAALEALERGEIDRALVGAVTHQRNFLVEHHFARIDPPVAPERLGNAAGFLVVSRRADARAARLSSNVTYRAHDPRHGTIAPEESCVLDPPLETSRLDLGCASLPVALASAVDRGGRFTLEHRVRARDGIEAFSRWGAP